MAIATANDIVTEVQAFYPGADTTSVQDYMNIVMNELCRDLPIVMASASLSLTADQGEYNLASGAPWYVQGSTTTASSLSLVKIESAHYIPASGSYRALQVTSTQELDAKIPNWRYHSSGMPSYVYANTNSSGGIVIGVYPEPSATSSPANGSGFPRVDFQYRAKYGSTFTGTQTIPSSITDPTVIIHGILWRIFERENNGNAAEYYQKYNMAKGRLFNELTSRLRTNKPTTGPRLTPPRVV